MDTPPKPRLYIAGFFLLTLALLVFVQAAFNLNPFLSPSLLNQTALLYTLSTFIFLVLLVFAFVLLRTLIKVWAERRQQKPGSQFKTSLLMSMIALTLVPAVLLFGFAFGLVNRSIDKWFSAPVDDIYKATDEINRQWRLEREEFARSILSHLGQQPEMDLDKVRQDFNLDGLFVLDGSGHVLRSSTKPDVSLQIAAQAIPTLVNSDETFLDVGSEWIASRRIEGDTGHRVLVAVFQTPAQMASLQSAIATGRNRYNVLNENRKSYRDTYVYMLLLMTVLVLFAAVWIGLFLSKRITVPIEALSEATREISSGNLNHRVSVTARDELGQLVSLFNDMAEQLQGSAQELESRRRYMEIILENIPSGVISVDADLRINKINRAASTMFPANGSKPPTTLDDIFSGTDLAAIQQVLRDAQTNSVSREIAFVAPGRPTHGVVTATQLTAGGFVLVVEDLGEVVRAQTANAWREVARRLAHEIKNPLTPIQLSAERIGRNVARLTGAAPRVTNVIEECVESIVAEVSSLKHLVDEFVRFARLPAVSRVPNNMKELVDRTMALYDGRLSGIAVSVDVPETLPLVLLDPLQMRRVLVNLLDNALEALAGEQAPELHIRCELARDATMARLTISDTGRGIEPDDRDRVFTPYFSTRKNGTGLGLAISSRVIADHGGYFAVEPNSPKGTRFIIELPVCQESSLSMTSQVSGSH
jgi:two-component system, NtrC family, nitrogen regulation sensor histidine kinase NtrY